jgi:hypothetical protein
MYACIREARARFFEGVRPPSSATAHVRDPPPPPLDWRIDSGRYALAVRQSGYTQDEGYGLPRTPQRVEKLAIWPVGGSKTNTTPPNQGQNTA